MATRGVGADAVLECVGTQESMMQAIRSARKGGYVAYVGVPHGVEFKGEELFFAPVHLHGGPAQITPDESSYVYSYRRALDELYLATGLR